MTRRSQNVLSIVRKNIEAGEISERKGRCLPSENYLSFEITFVNGERALSGLMEQGARLSLEGDVLTVIARNDIYVRYLNDNRDTIGEFASEFFDRPITVRLETAIPKVTNGAQIPPELR